MRNDGMDWRRREQSPRPTVKGTPASICHVNPRFYKNAG